MRQALISESAAATQAMGAALSTLLRAGDVVLLHGDLGSGKTTLVQGIAAGLGITAAVASPTFTLANEYGACDGLGQPITLAHLDLYRISDNGDLDSIGLEDYLSPMDAITLIEWPERARERLGGDWLLIVLDLAGAETRRLAFSAHDEGGRFAWLSRFITDSVSQIPGIVAAPTDDTPDRASPGAPPAG